MERPKKLPKAFKKKWVEALRSGKYQQCTGQLHDGYGYCCLGVACVISGVEISDGQEVIEFKVKGIPSVITGHGNKSSTDRKTYNPTVAKLAAMNDGNIAEGFQRHDFKQIADYIEQNL